MKYNECLQVLSPARLNKYAQACGLLEHDAADIQKTQNSYTAMGVYNNDKMVASFTFGFWTYLFTKRNYRVGGKTLLKIFPNKAHGLKQSDIYR